MGTRERKQRDFVGREKLFLDTARELIRQDGLLNLQMARIAEKCEYAVGTLYQHFTSKEDLLVALTCEHARLQVDLFERALRWNAPARNRIFALGVADMLFLQRYPDHFRLAQYASCEVVWQAASPARRQLLMDAHKPMCGVVTELVEQAVAAGDLQLNGLTPQELTTGPWALTVGMQDLARAEGVLDDFGVHQPWRLMCRHMQALLNGLGWKPLADLSDGAALDALIERISNEVFRDAL